MDRHTAALTKDHLTLPIHPMTTCSKDNLLDRGFPHWGRNTSQLRPSIQRSPLVHLCTVTSESTGLRLTFSDWHSQPRFPSWGHPIANVALRASTIEELVGSSISAGFDVFD